MHIRKEGLFVYLVCLFILFVCLSCLFVCLFILFVCLLPSNCIILDIIFEMELTVFIPVKFSFYLTFQNEIYAAQLL